MIVKIINQSGDVWRRIADAARTTIGKDAGEGEPSPLWKRRMLLCEHSPIRKLTINWKWFSLRSWVSVHFVRHKFGIEHWVRTQRTDRTGIDRNALPQGALVEHEAEANAQAIINISRKRLCRMASQETREAWIKFLSELLDVEPELVAVCVPDCIYRGHCFEYNSCGYFRTDEFRIRRIMYRKGINEVQEVD